MDNAIKSVWITANAGSGKTTNLTERVVRLLLLGVPAERIVCITYTKAAASEMRSRVLDALRALLLEPEAACRARVEKLLGAPADEAMLIHARGLFGAVLDSPNGGLQLTTIHGFCQNLLKRFPLEANVAPHFTVLEDAAADDMLRLAKHRMLERFENGDAALSEAFALIGERSGEYRFDALMADIVKKRQAWEVVWRAQSIASLRDHLFALHEVDGEASYAALDHMLCNCIDETDAATIQDYLPQLLRHKNKGEQNMGQVLARWLDGTAAERMALIPEFSLLFLTQKGSELRKRRVRLLNTKDFPSDGALAMAIDGIAQSVVWHAHQQDALACAEESFAIAVLARTLLQQYDIAKVAANALDYDDLIEKTVVLCSHPATLGWVMSKLDHRIDHLLIDEAQDTSGPQWTLAKTLVEELIASNDGMGSANQPRSLLVVGDEKQSIYSFQGAVPALFAKNRAHFQGMLDGGPSPLETATLDTSYRSAQAVLALVNHIAAMPEIAPALSSGEIHEHRLHHQDVAGCVALHPLIAAPEKEKPAPLTIPLEYLVTKNAAQVLAEHVAATIAQWLQVEKRLLKSQGRPLAAGDILILVRSRTPLVLPLIRALQRQNIPVAGLDRLMLSDHLAVRDLLALMAWCINPADDLALAQVLRSPLIGWSDEQLRALAFNRRGTLWAEVEHPLLSRWLEKKQMTPYDFLTEVLEVSVTRLAYARRFGEEVHEVLDELKAQAASMPAHMPPTLANFHDWLDGSPRQVKREQEAAGDHVRIMTVHGAKGLEAPVVLLIDTVNMPTTQHERMYFMASRQEQLLPLLALSPDAARAPLLAQAKEEKADALTDEYYRLLYVALTRARDELHIFGTANASGEAKPECWYGVIASAMKALDAKDENGVMTLRDMRPERAATAGFESIEREYALPVWATTRPNDNVPLQALAAPSRMVEMQASPYAQGSIAGAKERGVRIHRVLELLRPDSDPAHIAQLVRYVAPDWSEAQRSAVSDEIAKLFAQERWLWTHEVLPEASITGSILVHGQPMAVNGQMDLLVVTPDEIIIADYKTGRHIPASAGEVSLSYLIQLKTYQALVAQLYPAKPVRCALIWTSGPSLMWLDEAVQNAQFPNQNVMLKTALAS